jgi:hypothetical protein
MCVQCARAAKDVRITVPCALSISGTEGVAFLIYGAAVHNVRGFRVRVWGYSPVTVDKSTRCTEVHKLVTCL